MAAICGVGLIGGSLGLALKRAYPRMRIRGVGRDPKQLRFARRIGAIDELETDIVSGVKGCELVVLASPISAIISQLARIGAHLQPGAVVTDVGSTKATICGAAREHLPGEVYFIGGHPLAGRERSGIKHADGDLFSGCVYVLCPDPSAPPHVLAQVKRMVKAIKAKPLILDPQLHDQVVAYTSHLPQLLSTSLANLLGKLACAKDVKFRLSGGGLRDLLRLAASPYNIWRDICSTNQENISRAISDYIDLLAELRGKLASPQLRGSFLRANDFHRRYFKVMFDVGGDAGKF